MRTGSAPGSAAAASGEQAGGTIRATLWPTRALAGGIRWFDELYIWSEGAPITTMQRARIQLNSVRDAFHWLAYDRVEQIGLTLSFGTVERAQDLLAALFESNVALAHRTHVILRGDPHRLRSRYRLRAFAEMLRGLQYQVGYRLSAPRISTEIAGVDLVEPSFAKVLATTSPREEAWNDLALDVKALGLDLRATIVGGIEAPGQAELAQRAGFELAQGRAIRPPYPPPRSRRAAGAS